jgi:hypothetical protein
MKLILFVVASLIAYGQATVLIPTSEVCTAPQVMTATPGATLGTYTVMTLTCGTAAPASQVIQYPPLVSGPSGALTVNYPPTAYPPQVEIVTAVLPQKQAANVWTGANDFSASPFLAIPFGTPTNSSQACTSHSIMQDAAYIYVCTGGVPNSGSTAVWMRLALTSF